MAAKEVLIFEDTFQELNSDIWVHDITMAGGGNWCVLLIDIKHDYAHHGVKAQRRSGRHAPLINGSFSLLRVSREFQMYT